MKKWLGIIGVLLLGTPLLAGAEPIAFEQAANVTGLAGIEAGADFNYSYEKVKAGTVNYEQTLTDVPVFVRVGIPILEGKLTLPYGSLKTNVASVSEKNYSGLKNVDIQLKTAILSLPVFSFGVGVRSAFPTGDAITYLRDGFNFEGFAAAGLDLMLLKLNANVAYEYRGEFTTTVDPTGHATAGTKIKPGDATHFAVGLEIPTGSVFSLHAELLGSNYGEVKFDNAGQPDTSGMTLSLVPGIRAHAGPLKVKLGMEIPLENKDKRPVYAPVSDWRVIAGASLQFSL